MYCIIMNYSSCKNTTALTTTWSRSDRRRGLNLDLVVAHADGQGVLECFNTIENDCWIPLTSLPEESGIDGVTIAGYRNKVRMIIGPKYIFVLRLRALK